MVVSCVFLKYCYSACWWIGGRRADFKMAGRLSPHTRHYRHLHRQWVLLGPYRQWNRPGPWVTVERLPAAWKLREEQFELTAKQAPRWWAMGSIRANIPCSFYGSFSSSQWCRLPFRCNLPLAFIDHSHIRDQSASWVEIFSAFFQSGLCPSLPPPSLYTHCLGQLKAQNLVVLLIFSYYWACVGSNKLEAL